jgi:hypothetical protein
MVAMNFIDIGLAPGELTQAAVHFQSLEEKKYYQSTKRDISTIRERCASSGMHAADSIYLRMALACWLFGDELDEVELAVTSVAKTAPEFRAERLTKLYDPGLDGFFAEAIAKTLLSNQAPERRVLHAGAEFMLSYLTEQEKLTHITLRRWHVESCILALMAHRLDVAEKLIALVKTSSAYPETYPLVKRMVSHARLETHSGIDYIRIKDENVRQEFIRYFDAHRVPAPGMFKAKFPDDHLPFLCSGMMGPYCLAWLYLQVFAPVPRVHFAREDMCYLLTN